VPGNTPASDAGAATASGGRSTPDLGITANSAIGSDCAAARSRTTTPAWCAAEVVDDGRAAEVPIGATAAAAGRSERRAGTAAPDAPILTATVATDTGRECGTAFPADGPESLEDLGIIPGRRPGALEDIGIGELLAGLSRPHRAMTNHPQGAVDGVRVGGAVTHEVISSDPRSRM